MPTEKQRAASRANGARSRGPKTPEGKARSSRNSLRHGLLARAVLLEGEHRARFDELVELLNSSLRPKTELDHLFIGKMAAAHWRQLRIWALEREGNQSLGDREMRLDRQFFRTLDRYFKMQKFLDETNPASTCQPELSAFPGSRFEPAETQTEPAETRREPGETQTEPGETQTRRGETR